MGTLFAIMKLSGQPAPASAYSSLVEKLKTCSIIRAAKGLASLWFLLNMEH